MRRAHCWPSRNQKLSVSAFSSRELPRDSRSAGAFSQELCQLGYIEGKNVIIEWRWAENQPEPIPRLAAELAGLGVDVIVTGGTAPARALKNATRTIPIVMLLSYSDPVELGFVASFARPGGNITGVALAAEPTMAGKRLELIKEVVPRATRIAVLGTGETQSRTQVQWAEKVAPSLGVKLVVVEVRNGDYDRAFATIVAERAEAVSVVASVILSTDVGRIIQLAAKYRLPAIHEWREHAEAGGLMAYGGSVAGFTRRAAAYVDRILKGANPAELPVERATRFEFVVNLKTAKALGLTIPQAVLGRADQVIE